MTSKTSLHMKFRIKLLHVMMKSITFMQKKQPYLSFTQNKIKKQSPKLKYKLTYYNNYDQLKPQY